MSFYSRYPGSFSQFEQWLDVRDGTLMRIPSLAPQSVTALLPEAGSGLQPITSTQLLAIVPSASGSTPLATNINQAIRDAGITNWVGQAMFIAQVAHESANFKKLFEDGGKTVYNAKTDKRSSYKDWKRLHPKETTSAKDDDEQVYDYFFFMYDKGSPDPKRQKVAVTLGNTQPGDGERYRGRGYIQLTGRSSYQAAGKALGLDFENNPDLAADPSNAARIAGWFWKSRKLNNFTKVDNQQNFKAITKRINGGYNGLADRTRIYERAKNVLEPKPGQLTMRMLPLP